ncbi:MAG TPA: malonyl-CoA synthase [Geminicoccaceae bacterium]|nr:malonyl-CoA synthase [Geminicoccaceae bacterium]
MSESLFAHLRAATRDPERPFLETGTQRYGYGDLDRFSAAIGRRLRALGVEKGDRVAAQVEKSPQAVFLYLACLRIGAVYLPLNTGYTLRELDYFFGDAEPRVIVCDPSRESDIAGLASAGAVLTLDGEGRGSLVDGIADGGDLAPVACAPDDLAALLYTSGTTGRSKGAMLTHRNLLSNAIALREIWGFADADVLLHALPIYHTHGLFVAINTVLLAGARMLFLPRFDPDAVIAALPQATVMMGVPTYYTRLLARDDFTAEAARSMRVFISGSAPLLEETFAAFEARTGHRILERYGMTETGMNTSNPLHGERRPGTVGLPLPGVELRVAGDDGRPLAPGEVGILEVRGPNVFKGYWRMPEKTAQEFRADGFFITGDVGVIGADGYVSIVGRAKDLVISGGLNVYPKEVESLIDRLPGVVESAVIGLPHPDFGEAVAAVVVRHPEAAISEAEIVAAARAELAGFKVPKCVLFVEALPRNSMGKVQKNVLRTDYGKTFQ